jgi:hypothetical protein
MTPFTKTATNQLSAERAELAVMSTWTWKGPFWLTTTLLFSVEGLTPALLSPTWKNGTL